MELTMKQLASKIKYKTVWWNFANSASQLLVTVNPPQDILFPHLEFVTALLPRTAKNISTTFLFLDTREHLAETQRVSLPDTLPIIKYHTMALGP